MRVYIKYMAGCLQVMKDDEMGAEGRAQKS